MLLAGPKQVIPKCPGGTQDQGEAGGVLHQNPESSCLQIPNVLEKARFQAGGNSLTLFLLVGTTGMTGAALGAPRQHRVASHCSDAPVVPAAAVEVLHPLNIR